MKLLPCSTMLMTALVAGATARAAAPQPPAGGVHAQIVQVAEDIVYTSARLYPLQATALGLTGHDGELDVPSEAARAAFVRRLQDWQAQLRRIAPDADAGLSLTDRDDVRLLQAQLTQQLNGLQVYQQDRKDYSAGANAIVNAVFTQLQFLPVAGQDGATAADVDRAWQDITSRLEKAPAYIAAAQRLATHPGHLFGIVGGEQLAGAADLFNGALTDAATAHYGAGSAALERFARARDATLATIAATKAFIDAHVDAWPENFVIGRRAYDRMLADEKLLPFSAADLERMGRELLASGWTEEAWLTSVARQTHVEFGPQSGGGMAPTGPALIDYYRDHIAELGRFVTSHDVVTVPQWLGQMQVMPTPVFMQPIMPGAWMLAPRTFSPVTTTYYFITPPVSLKEAAERLDMNQDFDSDRIFSSAAHEAMPGHFLQLSIARRHGDFVRRIQGDDDFIEGWAFYGEEMFVRLGLYGERLDGRLEVARWVRVRGARVVADVKLASGEWTVQQAADFYAREAAFTPEQAMAAIKAIATEPGHFIAYTVGRFQIEELLGQYWRLAGAKASLHDFHDRLLSYGSTPLAIVGAELLADLDKPVSAVRAAANY